MASPTSSLGTLQSLSSLSGLVAVLVGGAPEDHPSGNFADRHRHVELTGDAQDVVLHPLRPDLGSHADMGCIGGHVLDLGAKRVVEHGLHAGAPAHLAGFLEGDIIELDR